MQYLEIIIILAICLLFSFIIHYQTVKFLKSYIRFLQAEHDEKSRELNSFKCRGGLTEHQIVSMKNKILVLTGRDLNELQVLSIMLAWRDKSLIGLGAENEFIENYIKEHRW